jgi:predicted RNA polymerase sigma factor
MFATAGIWPMLRTWSIEIPSSFVTRRFVEQTGWDEIVRLYDVYMQIAPSPVIALNRAIAVAHSEPTRCRVCSSHCELAEPLPRARRMLAFVVVHDGSTELGRRG